MKKTTLLIGVLIGLASFELPNAHPPSRGTDPLEEGLVAHYTFNQCDARDDTGNGSHGILFGNPGCHCGVQDDAIFLDGINDYLEFHGQVNRYFTTSDFTVSFYFKPAGYNIFRQSLLSKRSLCHEYNMLDLQLDLIRREVNTAVYETPEKYYRDISPKTPATDWVHFALVREGTRAYTYINGELRQEGFRCSGVDIANDAVLSFSNSPCIAGGRTVRFKGGLDELRVYDRALSHAEIAELYARYPVELAEIDCISFLREKPRNQRNPTDINPPATLALSH